MDLWLFGAFVEILQGTYTLACLVRATAVGVEGGMEVQRRIAQALTRECVGDCRTGVEVTITTVSAVWVHFARIAFRYLPVHHGAIASTEPTYLWIL